MLRSPILAVLATFASTARAASVQVEAAPILRWDAPASCPSAVQLQASVERNLGRALDDRDAAALRVDAGAHPRADGRWALRLRLTTHEPDGASTTVERALVTDSCSLLADAAALIVTVAIDPERGMALAAAGPTVADTSEPTPPAAVPVPPVAALPAAAASPTAAAPAPATAREPPGAPAPPPPVRKDRLRWTLAAAAGLEVGALPRPTAGVLVRTGLLAPRLRAELGFAHFFEQEVRSSGTDAGGAMRLTAGQLWVCPRLFAGPVELPLCAGLELGAMRGRGVGLRDPGIDRVPWVAVLAAARVLWAPVRRLALVADVGLAVPLGRVRFVFDDVAGDVHRAAPVGFRGGLGLELQIP